MRIRFNAFAVNRIAEIQEGTISDEWYMTPGKLILRIGLQEGNAQAILVVIMEWQSGPEFLQKPISE